MARWEPGSAERLRLAAMDLFVAKGYDDTTVADIAAAAGVTERTFFRYYADKREVLFGGQDALVDAFDSAVASAPGTSPLEIAVAPVFVAGEFFSEERRAWSRRRAGVINANSALQERELLKMAGLTEVLAGGLAARGFDAATASVSAHAGIGAFRETFRRWVSSEPASWADIADDVVGTVRGLFGGGLAQSAHVSPKTADSAGKVPTQGGGERSAGA